MVRLEDYGILDEPNVLDAMKSGADVISFSGDKLMGGPQAGIIIGKREYIEAMKKSTDLILTVVEISERSVALVQRRK